MHQVPTKTNYEYSERLNAWLQNDTNTGEHIIYSLKNMDKTVEAYTPK